MKNISPTTIAQLASLIESDISKKFKEILIEKDDMKSICLLLGLKSIHFDLKIINNSISESSVTEILYNFFETYGFSCELMDKEIPHWDVHKFLKNGDRIGIFNSDIYPKKGYDNLLITISPNFPNI